MKKNYLASFFEFISTTIMGSEKAFLDLLSAFVPYCVPVIPAYLTYNHTIKEMGFPGWVAGTAAFVVEVLGMASVSTAIRFWRNNQKYKREENKAPFKLAIGVYAFYIVIVLVVNVVLEIVSGTRSGWVIFSIGAFSLLSFPSGVLISIRTNYSEMLEERKFNKITAKGQPLQVQAQGMGFSNMQRPKFASDYHDKIIAMLNDAYSSGKVLQLTEITSKLKLDHNNNKGYVSTLRKEWKAKKGIKDDVL